LKIAIASYELLPQTGTSARTLGFVRALVGRKHEVTIFGPNGKNLTEVRLAESLGADYIGVCPFAIKPGSAHSMVFALGLLRKLNAISRKSHIDVLQFTDYSMNCFIYPLIKRSLGIPIVSDLHALVSSRSHEPGLDPPLWKWLIFLIYEKLALNFSDAVVTPTEELRELLDRRYQKNISAIPNCVSYLTKNIHSAGSSEKSSEWRIFFHANFLLERSVRELTRLSEIASRIQARGYRLRVFIAGPGTTRLGNLQEPLINLGYVSDPYDFLLNSDLVILPVKDLTMGLHSRLVEAMAAARPIVATKEACCGLFPYLNESGIILCDSVEEMVESACSLLNDRNRMDTLGALNRRLADRLFSPRAVGLSLERVYSTIINK
jgi:glycosyltransferase involved in cell wall biosynthesis